MGSGRCFCKVFFALTEMVCDMMHNHNCNYFCLDAIFDMSTTNHQMARDLVNVGSIHHLNGQLFQLKRKGFFYVKSKVERISSAQQSYLDLSPGTICTWIY